MEIGSSVLADRQSEQAGREDTALAQTTAKAVADFFIWFSHEHGDQISNLKLQKLLYYAQAWFLALYDRPLFPERLEAWIHGPAAPPVYGEYKAWGWRPIAVDVAKPNLDPKVVDHLTEILEVYGPMSAYELERLTHSEAPWRDARGPIPEDEASAATISHESMAKFYKSRVNGKNP